MYDKETRQIQQVTLAAFFLNLVNKGPGYVFKNAGIVIHITKQDNAEAALTELIRKFG